MLKNKAILIQNIALHETGNMQLQVKVSCVLTTLVLLMYVGSCVVSH